MVKNITIQAGDVILSAELNETDTANAVWDALPIHSNGNTWGHEIYFQIQVESNLENGQEIVELGDLAYWPPGSAFCLFFGLTPASQGDEIRPASEVTVIGKMIGDIEPLKSVGSGSLIVIDAA